MIQRMFLGCVSLVLSFHAVAQTPLTLDTVLQRVMAHYPATKQKEYVKSLGKTNEQLVRSNDYPQVSVTGQATYQSEVTKFDFPGIVGPKPDNYNVGLDLRLPLTDFDITKTKQQLEQQKTQVNLQQLDVDLQRIRERVTAVFGNILLQKENRKILVLRKSDLESQHKKLTVVVANGAMLKSNLLVLESEVLSTEQKLIDIDATILSLTQELSILTGVAVSPNDEFQLPASDQLQTEVQRPELKLFQSQITVLNMQDKILKKENRAKLFLFGQGFYGRPGYNFLNQDFRFYGISGVGIHWNINNSVLQKTKEQTFSINKSIVQQQEAIFRMNLETALVQKQTEINKYSSVISKDEAIVNKRKEILKVASSQLENGAITSTEYITELNAENAAELNLLLHRVQSALAVVQYNTLSGY